MFVDLLGLTLVLPALPFHTAALGGTGLALGVVVAAFSAAQAVAAPLLGRLADRCGRRRVLLVGLAGSTALAGRMAGPTRCGCCWPPGWWPGRAAAASGSRTPWPPT